MLLFTPVNSLFLLVILSCTLYSAECQPWFVDGMRISAGEFTCKAYDDDYAMGFQEFVVGLRWRSFGTLCVGSHLLCVYLTLPGICSLKHNPSYGASKFSGTEFDVVRPLGSIWQAVGWISYSSWLTDQSMFRVSPGTTLSSPLSSREGGHLFSYTRSDNMVRKNVYSRKIHMIGQKIETWKTGNTDIIKVIQFDGSSLEGPTCLRHDSAISESTPLIGSYLEKFFFHISNPCAWQCSFFMRNNLSYMQNSTYACSSSGYKHLYAKIIENLTAEVRNVGKKACLLGEIIVHTSTSLVFESEESTKLFGSYKIDSLATSAHNNIEFPVIADVFLKPMKASLSSCMFNLSRKSVFLVQMNKYCVIPLLAAFLLSLIFCCLFSLSEAVRSEDCLYKNASETLSSVKNLGKPSDVRKNMKNIKTSVSSGEIRILRQGSVYKNPDQGITRHKLTSSLRGKGIACVENYVSEISPYSPQSTVAIVNSDTLCTSPTAGLTARKRRDRKKQQDKKVRTAPRLTEFLKDSSSICGNYSPSPTPPVRILMAAPGSSRPSKASGYNEPKKFSTQVADQQRGKSQASVYSAKILGSNASNKFQSTSVPSPPELSLPRKTYSRALMLSFSAFHCADKSASNLERCYPILASRSTVSPYERAPGPNLTKQKDVKTVEPSKLGDIFTYDIWCDHWSGLCLMRKPKDVSLGHGSDSESLFVRGPQALFAGFLPRSVSVHQKGY